MVLEETSGASTVNGPDVLRISRQPWSGAGGGVSEWVWEARRHQSWVLESCGRCGMEMLG